MRQTTSVTGRFRGYAAPWLRALLLSSVALGCAASDSPVSGGAPETLRIDPASITLALSGTDTSRSLSAYRRIGEGAESLATGVSWSVTDTTIARVSATGVLRARAAGTTVVRATLPGLEATASVTVNAGTAAVTPFFVEDFEDANFATRGWYDNGTLTTTTTNPAVGTRALVGAFAVGANTPSWGAARLQFAPTESLYVSFYVRYSDNWVGSGQTYHPHEFFILTTESGAFAAPAWSRLTVYIEHNKRTGGGFPVLGMQDGQNIDVTRIGQNLVGVTENRSVAGCNGSADGIPSSCFAVGAQQWNWKSLVGNRPVFSDTAGPRSKAVWHRVEVFFAMNTIVGGVAQANGIARYWIDGALEIDATNVQFRTGARPTQRFNQLMLSPYIGDGSPVAQTVWIDRLELATRRP